MENMYPCIFLLASNNDITMKCLIQGNRESGQDVFRWGMSFTKEGKRLELKSTPSVP